MTGYDVSELDESRGAEVVASWDGPGWAERSETDEDALIFIYQVGSVVDLDGNERTVVLEQRDEVRSAPDQVAIDRSPAYVLLDGVRYSLAEVGRLGSLLTSASRLPRAAERSVREPRVLTA